MEGKLKLIMLTPESARAHWGYFIEGLESVLDRSTGDSTLASILNNVLTGQMTVWVGYLNEEYVGLCTTRYVDVPQGEKYIEVLHGYMKPGQPYSALLEGMDEIERYGVKYGCKSIRFFTTRDKGFEKKMAPMGFKKGYTEFKKDLRED